MATTYYYPNGNDGGWVVSTNTNCDDGFNPGNGLDNDVTGPNDATFITCDDEAGDILNLDTGVGSGEHAIVDGDTITQVQIKVRATLNASDADSNLQVDLIIGGTAQGTQQETGHLTGSFVTYTLSTTGWDSDWTAAQIAGMQVRLTSEQGGMPSAYDVDVSEVEVIITYTPDASVTEEPPEEDLFLTGKVPTLLHNSIRKPAIDDLNFTGKVPVVNELFVRTIPYLGLRLATQTGLALRGSTPTIIVTTGGDLTEEPPKGTLTLTGKVPTLFREDTITVPERDLTLAGKVPTVFREDYITPPIEELDLAGKVPVVARDIIVPERDLVLDGKVPTVFREDTITVPERDLVLSGKQPSVKVGLNTPAGALVLDGKVPTLFREDTITVPEEALALTGKVPVVARNIIVPERALTLDGKVPTLFREDTITVPEETLALAGKVPVVARDIIVPERDLVLNGKQPSVERSYTITVPERDLTLNGKIPEAATGLLVSDGALSLSGKVPTLFREDSITPPIDELNLAGKVPTLFREDSITPPIEELDLAGKLPVLAQTRNHWIDVGGAILYLVSRRGLWLRGLTPTITVAPSGSPTITPAVEELNLAGKVPTLFREGSITPAVEELNLTGKVPTIVVNHLVTPAIDALVLDGKIPTIPAAEFIAEPDAGALALSGKTPTLAGSFTVQPAAETLVLSGKAPTLPALTDVLNINAWDNGWPNGFISNITEATANADGSAVSTTLISDVVVFDLDDTSIIRDLDIVTRVDVKLRIRATSDPGPVTNPWVQVELLVGAFSQGTVALLNLPSSFTTYSLNDSGWNSDWTLSQLNSMQVRVTTQGTASDHPEYFIDCADVVVTYTYVPPHVAVLGAGSLALAGKVPVPDEVGGFQSVRPAATALTLAGESMTFNWSIAAPEKSLSLQGKPFWATHYYLQLQPNAMDDFNNWEVGNVTNIDEPTQSADAQTISTDQDVQIQILHFDDVTGIIDPLDDILNITVRVRARFDGPGSSYDLQVDVGSEGILLGGPPDSTISYGGSGYTNHPLGPSWYGGNGGQDITAWKYPDTPWTVPRLNDLIVQLVPFGLTTPGIDFVYLDAIDVVVTYAPQSPMVITPPAAELSLSTDTVTLDYAYSVYPAAETLALTGKVPPLFRQDAYQPPAEFLFLAYYPPIMFEEAYRLPAIDTLSLSGKAPTTLVNHLATPAAETLALSGKVPVAETTADHVTEIPGHAQLYLRPEASIIQTATTSAVSPPREQLSFEGQAPTADTSRNVWTTSGSTSLALAGAAPTLVQGKVRVPATEILTLTATVPAVVPSTVINVPAGAWTLSTGTPQLGLAAADLALTTYQPTILVDSLRLPAKAELRLIGRAIIADAARITMVEGSLVLNSYAPTLTFTSTISAGEPGLINVTTRRGLEHIATPLA
jgi:hypothetical protein